MALFHERRPNHLDARLVRTVHDELVRECPEGQAEEAAGFLKGVMVEGMDEVLHPGVGADRADQVPVEVDIEVVESWGG